MAIAQQDVERAKLAWSRELRSLWESVTDYCTVHRKRVPKVRVYALNGRGEARTTFGGSLKREMVTGICLPPGLFALCAPGVLRKVEAINATDNRPRPSRIEADGPMGVLLRDAIPDAASQTFWCGPDGPIRDHHGKLLRDYVVEAVAAL